MEEEHCRLQTVLEVSGGVWDTAWDTGLHSATARLAKNGDSHLHLSLSQKAELAMDVKTSVSLGCRDHARVGCHLPGGRRIEECRC